jgi:hypothetical protein
VVAGHTDGIGSEGFNQDLSDRRADTIRRYLVHRSGLAERDLVAVGYGKTKLKDAASRLIRSTVASRWSTWMLEPLRTNTTAKGTPFAQVTLRLPLPVVSGCKFPAGRRSCQLTS